MGKSLDHREVNSRCFRWRLKGRYYDEATVFISERLDILESLMEQTRNIYTWFPIMTADLNLCLVFWDTCLLVWPFFLFNTDYNLLPSRVLKDLFWNGTKWSSRYCHREFNELKGSKNSESLSREKEVHKSYHPNCDIYGKYLALRTRFLLVVANY